MQGPALDQDHVIKFQNNLWNKNYKYKIRNFILALILKS